MVRPERISPQSPSITSSTCPAVPPPKPSLDDSSDSSDDEGVIIIGELLPGQKEAESKPGIVSADIDIWKQVVKPKSREDVMKSKLKELADGSKSTNRSNENAKLKSKYSESSKLKSKNSESKLKSKSSESPKLKSMSSESPKLKSKSSESSKLKSKSSESPKFKIPKGPSKFPGYDAHSKERIVLNGEPMSVRRFLKEEGIIPNFGSFLKDDDWKKVEAMYDKVINIKKNVEVKHEAYDVKDASEVGDLQSQNDAMKMFTNDEERKEGSKKMFKNEVSSDPGNNLTFHGFRRCKSGNKSKSLDRRSFSISDGTLKPRQGYKRISNPHETAEEEEAVKKKIKKMIRFQDHGLVMKKLFVHKFNKSISSKKAPHEKQEQDEFLTYLGHYKTGQEETANFLAFYNSRKELELDQVKEVVDLESQFSTFSNYYGEPQGYFCKDCRKEHKFCQ